MKCKSMAVFEAGKPLRELSIEVQDPPPDEGLIVKIGGAGMCRTDLRLWRGTEPRPGFNLPFVLGHENAGVVYDCGNSVPGLKKGDQVIVYSVWGDLRCDQCLKGKFMLCRNQKVPGQSYFYGGYAEFMLVHNYRFVRKIEGIDPAEAAPLADAGVTSYSAIQKIVPYLREDSIVIVYGVGGLASYGIQILRKLHPDVKIIAVSRSKRKLDWSMELGATVSVLPSDLKRAVEQGATTTKTKGRGGVTGAIDFVGTEESTMQIADCLDSGGIIVEVGMEGERLSLPTFGTTVWEYQLIGSNYGTLEELSKVVELVKGGTLRSHIFKRKLDEANEALKDLAEGSVLGRYVLVP
jgi:D-arabinose 1-dehydrogenase